MKKVKLPRKRKKRFIKELGLTNYIAYQVIAEIVFEKHDEIDNRFPAFKKGEWKHGKPVVDFYY
jgi:hypothetical protein